MQSLTKDEEHDLATAKLPTSYCMDELPGNASYMPQRSLPAAHDAPQVLRSPHPLTVIGELCRIIREFSREESGDTGASKV